MKGRCFLIARCDDFHRNELYLAKILFGWCSSFCPWTLAIWKSSSRCIRLVSMTLQFPRAFLAVDLKPCRTSPFFFECPPFFSPTQVVSTDQIFLVIHTFFIFPFFFPPCVDGSHVSETPFFSGAGRSIKPK